MVGQWWIVNDRSMVDSEWYANGGCMVFQWWIVNGMSMVDVWYVNGGL